MTQVNSKSATPKKNSSLEQARKKSRITKVDAEYPPEIADNSSMSFKGKDMVKMYRDKEMKHSDFTGSDLSGADFTDFNLQGSIFKNVNITDTNFSGADLRWSLFENAEGVETANFEDANISEVAGL
jgi:uncharacterized protein YjbI with pentapeptide repeats